MFNLACHRYDSIISVGARTTIHREYILRRISFEVRLQLFLYEYLSLSLILTLTLSVEGERPIIGNFIV